jgi:proton-translocating NADH-quinone oxidoreductase chain L
MIVVILGILGFSFCIQGIFGRYLGRTGGAVFSIIAMLVVFLYGLVCFYEVVLMGSIYGLRMVSWVSVGSVMVSWGFVCDILVGFMVVVVLGVSLLVHVYSVEYMSGDPHRIRFMAYLTLFTLFMLILVSGDNLLQTLLGWEGVGLVSYLLVNFWYSRVEANRSALKAVIVNRVGDYGLFMGIILVYYNYGSFDYGIILCLSGEMGGVWNVTEYIGYLLCIGAIGKSAQIGLHVWLPDAMEGPTPVSALIHAATMVTAGVFILIKLGRILEESEMVCFFLVVVGGLTALFAGSTGIYQSDIKRVIAFSTCSQLGFMVVACGCQVYSVALFHLVNHAFFKALLFLSAGLVIHSLGDEQDMRKMGGLVRLLPVSYISILIGSLALSGFPFLSGFYSKELIYMSCFLGGGLVDELIFYILLVAGLCTSLYSFRLIWLVFLGETRMGYGCAVRVREEGYGTLFVLGGLCIGSLWSGFVFKELLGGFGVSGFGFFEGVIGYWVEVEMEEVIYRICPLIFGVIGIFLSGWVYGIGRRVRVEWLRTVWYKVYVYLVKKWCIDIIYNELVSDRLMRWGYEVGYKSLDRGLLMMVGTGGVLRVMKFRGKIMTYMQSGYLYHYVMELVVGVMLIVLCDRFIMEGSMLVVYLFLFVYLVMEIEEE